MSEPIRAAVVGVGSLGRHHARILASLEGVRLVGVTDSDPTRGLDVAREYGTTFFPCLEELVEKVDCASIVVPTTAHHAVCLPFLEAGKHLLVEKPIASSREDAADLVERAGKADVVLQVGHLERFNPAFLAVRPLISNPRFFEAHRLGVFVPRCLDVDVVMDLMIHDIDMVLSLVGKPVRAIHAVGIPILSDKVDIANVRLEFEGGAVANLTASRVSTEKVRKLRFFQPDDYISLDLGRQEVSVFSLRPADTPLGKEIVSRNILVEQGEPLRNELESFLSCVREGRRPLCAGEDGLAALEVAERILSSIQKV